MEATDGERLARIELQIERVIQAINLQTEAVHGQSVVIERIFDLLSEPGSTELSDLVARIAAVTLETHDLVVDLHQAALGPRQ